jgi:hypothetical protein
MGKDAGLAFPGLEEFSGFFLVSSSLPALMALPEI